MLTRCSHGVVGAKPLVSRHRPRRVEVPSCTGKAEEPPGCCSAPQGAALVVLGGPERPRGRRARAAKGDPAPGFGGKLLGPRESVWLYLSFPVPGQAAEHRLPKLSQTLPVSAPEPPGKDKSNHRREPQQQQWLSFSRGAQGTRCLEGGEALSALWQEKEGLRSIIYVCTTAQTWARPHSLASTLYARQGSSSLSRGCAHPGLVSQSAGSPPSRC